MNEELKSFLPPTGKFLQLLNAPHVGIGHIHQIQSHTLVYSFMYFIKEKYKTEKIKAMEQKRLLQ